jgi:hypothetical protein
MSRYLVTFFKRLSNSDGHIFNCPQQSIEIQCAKSVDHAIQAAERRYERLCKLTDWTLHADTLEVKIDGRRWTNTSRSRLQVAGSRRITIGGRPI